MPWGQEISIRIKTPKINITFTNVENDLTVKVIFGKHNLDNDQDITQAMNKEVRISIAGIKKSTLADYKQNLWLVRYGVIYLKEW